MRHRHHVHILILLAFAVSMPNAVWSAKKKSNKKAGKQPTLATEFKPLTKGTKFSARDDANVTVEDDEILLNRGYAPIGFVESRCVVERCTEREGAMRCESGGRVCDTRAEIMRRAARSGGDLVFLESDAEDDVVIHEGQRCRTFGTVDTYRYVYNHATRLNEYTLAPTVVCTAYESVESRDRMQVSMGRVWREDPELARRFRLSEELLAAVFLGDLEQVRQLVGEGLDLNRTVSAQGFLPLSVASLSGDVEMVRLLVSMGADVNGVDRVSAPLFQAVEAGHPEIVDLLLSEGASRKSRNPHRNETLLMAASRGGNTDIVRTLLSRGAKVDATDVNGTTALMMACLSGNSGVVRLLIEAGANVNKTNTLITPVIARWTPAMFAAYSLDPWTVVALLEAAPDLARRDYYGHDAVDLARILSRGGGPWSGAAFRILLGYEHGAWGYIDRTGAPAISPKYTTQRPFSEGLAPVAHYTGEQRRYGYIDKAGAMVIPMRYKLAAAFSEGLAAVAVGGEWVSSRGFGFWMGEKYGYINRSGETVIEPRFYAVTDFRDGKALVQGSRTDYFWINEAGEPIFADKYVEAREFTEGFAAVMIGEQWGFINEDGDVVIDCRFDGAMSFSEGLAVVKIGEKHGYIDTTGKVVIEPQFPRAGAFSEGRATIVTGFLEDSYGYIDRTGNIVIKPKYNRVEPFHDGMAWVQWGFLDHQGYIDRDGALVLGPDHYRWYGDFSEGLASVAWEGKAGYIDKEGKLVLGPLPFDALRTFSEGLAPAQRKGRRFLEFVSELGFGE